MTIRLGDLQFDHVVYDDVGDVLYLSVGEPREGAREEATPEGHLVRYDEDDRVIAITIVNAKWLIEGHGEIEISVRIGADDLAPALV
jgi:uncharacterized protein YuzE